MSILAPNNFTTGRWLIPQGVNDSANLQQYIDRVENYYLPRLFGKVLYDLFIADAGGGTPAIPRFQFVYDPFTTQETSCDFNQSLGIVDMIKGFVYFEYVRDNITRLTTVGPKRTDSANSQNASGIQHDITSRYNESIRTYKAIQYYMDNTNSADYPEYEGIFLRFNHTF